MGFGRKLVMPEAVLRNKYEEQVYSFTNRCTVQKGNSKNLCKFEMYDTIHPVLNNSGRTKVTGQDN